MKKQIPLLMSTMMVEAILAGRKTVTRRIIKAELDDRGLRYCNPHTCWEDWHGKGIPCPYGKPGDGFYVREEYYQLGHWEIDPTRLTKKGGTKWKFVADSEEFTFEAPASFRKGRHHKDPATSAVHKRLPRFMPKKYARIWLEVTDIRVERLQDISEEDAKAEGLAAITKDDGRTWKYGIPDKDGYPGTDDNGWPWHKWLTDPKESFFRLWTQINGEESLRQDPWLWVISFRVLSTTGKPAELEKEEAV